MTEARVPVSIVCVFNDPVVRDRCLDRSIDVLREEAPEVEYIPVDNTAHAFPTAGAALNHGAAQARNDVVVFVHQDVYLHSLVALELAAATLIADSGFGMLGAFGFTATGGLAGHIRDRVVLLGSPVSAPIEVDSLDEVLFMVQRRRIAAMPLSQEPELAWHAYAVEYGLRLRSAGLRVGAADIPLTHNSMTINLDKLDVAHRRVAALHPQHLPVRTTCGIVSSAEAPQSPPFLANHRWRYRWLKGSVAAHQARRAGAGTDGFVLSDIRLDVDDVLTTSTDPVHVFNLDPGGTFVDGRPAPVQLYRGERRVQFSSGDTTRLLAAVKQHDDDSAMLVTNLHSAALRSLKPALQGRPHVSGLHDDLGTWTLLRPDLASIPLQWRDPSAIPLGMAPVAR